MVDDIVGFAPNESSKQVTIRTINDGDDTERDEIFFGRININSPVGNTDIRTNFEKNVGTCTIKTRIRTTTEDHDPYETFEYTPEGVINQINSSIEDAVATPDGSVEDNFDEIGNTTTSPIYRVSANRSSVESGEFIIYTVETRNVVNGTVSSYRLSPNFTTSDIIGGILSSTFVINNNTAKITVGIDDNYESEIDKVLTLYLRAAICVYRSSVGR